jgi:hypothetical protein
MAADNRQQDSSQYTSIFSLAIKPGIKRDGTQFQNDQYTAGVWCRFQRGDPKKIGGYRTLFTSFSGIYRGMITLPNNGVNYIFAGTENTLDVFTTGANFGVGSGPFNVTPLPGISYANVTSNTTTQVVVTGDATAVFTPGSEIILTQSGTPTTYTITTSTFATPDTTIVFTPAAPAGTITKIWLNGSAFVEDERNLWQFDAQYNPQAGELYFLAHPGLNLNNVDNGVVSQVLTGKVTPDANDTYYFTGLSDSEGQQPTFQPIKVDGGVCVLYPFIFAYGSHGFIANNNVDLTLNGSLTNSFYDWNGTFANQNNMASSKIVKGVPMRGGTNSPSGLFWATDSLIRVSFNAQATQFYWTYDIISSQISIMSSSSVVEMDGTYFWMGVDRFYLYNGGVKVLPNDKNVNWLFNNINFAQRQKVWATKVPRYNEIWFFYPRGGATECTDAIIYNVKDDLWYDAGQAVGAQRSCGFTTELFPTPVWIGWNYDTSIASPLTIIEPPAGKPSPTSKQFYVNADVGIILSPGSYLSLSTNTATPPTIYQVAASLFYPPFSGYSSGVTLVTTTEDFVTGTDAGTLVFPTTGGYSIWQHEFGINQVTLSTELAVYSSITTSDISWLTGSPSQETLQGVNRRMHLRRVEPNFLQSGTMSMTILGRKFASGPYEETSGPFYFTQNTGKIDLRVEHRLVRLQFVSNEIGGNYEMGRNLITAEFGDERP